MIATVFEEPTMLCNSTAAVVNTVAKKRCESTVLRLSGCVCYQSVAT